ncbi:hypothetical protein QR98_0025870 [Sarcoptes scabiei]|nr:hypothetical protein QR98_0025870 [Sarcoptes scabiei]
MLHQNRLAFVSLTVLVNLFTLNLMITNGQHASSQNFRRQFSMMRSMAQKAFDHGMRINEEAKCSKPRPELVYLNDSRKMYLPRATLLHRCSNLIGCCPHATHSCEPIRKEKITLYFFVIDLQTSPLKRRSRNIEHLTFVNHTECACKPIDQPEWSTLDNDLDSDDDKQSMRPERFDPQKSTPNETLRHPELSQSSSRSKLINFLKIDGRNNGEINIEDERNSNDLYRENENQLRYWAKLMGYQADQKKSMPNRRPIIVEPMNDRLFGRDYSIVMDHNDLHLDEINVDDGGGGGDDDDVIIMNPNKKKTNNNDLNRISPNKISTSISITKENNQFELKPEKNKKKKVGKKNTNKEKIFTNTNVEKAKKSGHQYFSKNKHYAQQSFVELVKPDVTTYRNDYFHYNHPHHPYNHHHQQFPLF